MEGVRMSNVSDDNIQITMKDESARTRLLEKGLQIFGLYGFEGVRTRTLADAAEVNQSAIPYYFGGKKGLYLAVTHQLTENLKDAFLQDVLEVTSGIKEISKEKATDTLRTIVTEFSKAMLGNHITKARITFIAREQLQPTEAYDILYENFFKPLHHTISCLVGRLINLNEDDPQTIIIAHAILGQSIFFATAKEAYLRLQGINDLDEPHINDIARTLGELSICSCDRIACKKVAPETNHPNE
jgi:TetR/AcrR family transcriptional regulator, regulator of cefoperazone and chloramphenicol sensitivity